MFKATPDSFLARVATEGVSSCFFACTLRAPLSRLLLVTTSLMVIQVTSHRQCIIAASDALERLVHLDVTTMRA
jgi:hypothetical protein